MFVEAQKDQIIPFTVSGGTVVEAEVDVNIATLTKVEKGGELYTIKPICIAAKYLEATQLVNNNTEVDDDSKPIDWLAGKEEIKKLIDKLHVQCEIYTIDKGIESVKVYKETDGIRKNLFDWDRELTVSNEDFLDKVYQKLLTYDSLEVGGDHYQTAIQPWDFIYANHIPFDESCIIKYACRHKKKGGAEDVEKIISYAKHILKTQYNKDYE